MSSQNKRKNRKGFALVGALVLTVILAAFATISLRTAHQDGTMVENERAMAEALYLAEAGANRIAEAIWIGYEHTDPRFRVEWLDDNGLDYDQLAASLSNGQGTYTTQVVGVYPTDDPTERVFVFESTGKVGEIERTVTRIVKYGLGRSKVFDYVYFINNYGWFYGSTITANGDIRANGNFDAKYDPMINGDMYAAVNAEIGAAGVAGGSARHLSKADYEAYAQSQYRPTHPNAAYGYDGNQERHSYQQQLYMPWLNDISYYEQLATAKGGTISIGGTTVVNGVANDKIVLVGTAENPIVIDGPVVVKGDIAIKGVVRGQGTLYAERNVHVLGNVTYETPPMWPHDGTDIATVAEHNMNADFMGVAARGSVILGDYTESGWGSVKNYIKPPFTNGYTDEDGSWFNADYTASDGGTQDGGSTRRYYESTWSDSYFSGIASNNITQMDGLFYTNHLFGGRTGDIEINGSIISRDEAVIFSGHCDLNYDYRAREAGEDYIDIDLPKAPRMTQLFWSEREFYDDYGQINYEFHSALPDTAFTMN